MSGCIGEPVSWLALERHALGELSQEDSRALEEHLARCPACRTCREQIAADARDGASLLKLTAADSGPRRAADGPVRRARRSALWALAGVCAAALLALRGAWQRAAAPAEESSGVKGGEVALELLRMDAAGRALVPTRFAVTDRFKLRVTCPPALRGPVRVLIFQGGELFEPLPLQEVRCGNAVTLPGAFSMDGSEPAQVCAVFAKDVAARDPQQLAALGLRHACARVLPQRDVQ